MHEPVSYIGFVSNHQDKTVRLHSFKSPKQKARDLCRPYVDVQGNIQPAMSDMDIAKRLDKPVSVIQEWTQFHREFSEYQNG